MKDLVSVIITTYKRNMNILCRAIESVCNQDYDAIEIIVVNDFPVNKQIIDITLQQYPYIKIIHNMENFGACYSRNVGIKNATGKYIAFLDDDDEWNPNKISLQVEAMTKDIGLVYCTGERYYPDGTIHEMPFIKDCTKNPIETLLSGNCMGGCSFPLIRADVLKTLNGFDEALKSSQDYELWLRIVGRYRIAYIDKPLVIYHMMDECITNSFEKRIQGFAYLFKKHKKLFKKYPQSTSVYLNKIIGLCVLHKQYGSAAKYVVQSLKFFPENRFILQFWGGVVLKKINQKFKR